MASDFSYSLLAVQVHKVDRKSHEEGMDGFTGNNPQAFSRPQAVASQQAFPAFGSAIRHFHPFGNHYLAGEIENPVAHIRLSAPASGKPSKNAAQGIHVGTVDDLTSIEDRPHGIVGRQCDRATVGSGGGNCPDVRTVVRPSAEGSSGGRRCQGDGGAHWIGCDTD